MSDRNDTYRREVLADAITAAASQTRTGEWISTGRMEADAIAQAAQDVRLSAARLGGRAELAHALRLGGDAASIMSRTLVNGPVRRDTATAVGWLCVNVGNAAHDAGDERNAAWMWAVAGESARQARNASLWARVILSRARKEIWDGRPADANHHLERAWGVWPSLTAREQALLWSTKAQALGQLGDVEATRHAVDMADEAFAMAWSGDIVDRPWVSTYDDALHRGETADGLVYAALRTSDQQCVLDGTTRYQASIRAYTDDAVGSRLLSMLQLAVGNLAAGDPHQGVSQGHAGLDAADGYQSARVASEVGRVGERAGRLASRGVTAAVELRDRCLEYA